MLRLLEEAKAQGFADAITYGSAIDALANNCKPDAKAALRLLEEAKEIITLPSICHHAIIDLHGLSYGMVYFWLKHELIRLVNQSISRQS